MGTNGFFPAEGSVFEADAGKAGQPDEREMMTDYADLILVYTLLDR